MYLELYVHVLSCRCMCCNDVISVVVMTELEQMNLVMHCTIIVFITKCTHNITKVTQQWITNYMVMSCTVVASFVCVVLVVAAHSCYPNMYGVHLIAQRSWSWCLDKFSVAESVSWHLMVLALLWGSRCFLHGDTAWRNIALMGPAKTPHSASSLLWGFLVALGRVQWMRVLQTQIQGGCNSHVHIHTLIFSYLWFVDLALSLCLDKFSASALHCLEHSLLPPPILSDMSKNRWIATKETT